jgi:hypothetical protein
VQYDPITGNISERNKNKNRNQDGYRFFQNPISLQPQISQQEYGLKTNNSVTVRGKFD